MKSPVTSHILNTQLGKPAVGVELQLFQWTDQHWHKLATARTDNDGRANDLLPAGTMLSPGTYKLHAGLGAYFQSLGETCFYPFAEIAFTAEAGQHYHIPLLVSAFAFSTYRGS